jgi:hypothetical protein
MPPHLRSGARAAHDGGTAAYGRERIAQLVRQHREEFILALIRLAQRRLQRLARCHVLDDPLHHRLAVALLQA